jgi:hypothetical protein
MSSSSFPLIFLKKTQKHKMNFEEKPEYQLAFDSLRAVRQDSSNSWTFIGVKNSNRLGASRVRIFPGSLLVEQLAIDNNVLPYLLVTWNSINNTIVGGLSGTTSTPWNEFSFLYVWDKDVPIGVGANKLHLYKPVDRFYSATSDMSSLTEPKLTISDKTPAVPGVATVPTTGTLVSFTASFKIRFERGQPTSFDETTMFNQ